MSDDRLRAAFNAHVANNAPTDRSACPLPEQLQTLAESGQGGNSTNMKMLEHVFSCAFCRADFALLRASHAGVQSYEEAQGNSKRAFIRGWLSGPRLAIAATLLLALGIGGETWRRSRVSELRGVAVSDGDVVIVSPRALSTVSNDVAFVWRKVPGAVTYEIQLLDTAGVVFASHLTTDTVFTPTADERARIDALKSFDWFVSARRSDGNDRRSTLARVQIKR